MVIGHAGRRCPTGAAAGKVMEVWVGAPWKNVCMEMTGWISGQVFFQTVDQGEVEQINAFLTARGIICQVLTQSEHMMLDPADPSVGVTSERFSIAVQLGGFPQVIGPVLNELIQRAHGGGWQLDDSQPPAAD
jgi:hypothetical protein